MQIQQLRNFRGSVPFTQCPHSYHDERGELQRVPKTWALGLYQYIALPNFCRSHYPPSHESLVMTSASNDTLLKCSDTINVQAPILSLPSDILCLIFWEVHHTEIQTLRQPLSRRPLKLQAAPHKFQSPLSLSRVSRSWYDAINNSPLLWTTIDVYPPWNLSLIDMFLTRSKSCPIYLNIMAELSAPEKSDSYTALHADTRDVSREQLHFTQLCDMLIPHIHRCRSISILTDIHYVSLSKALQKHFRNLSAPLLETFFLQRPDNYAEANPQPIFTLGAPMLSHVHLTPCGVAGWCLPSSTSVTSLHLETHNRVNFPQFVAVLSQCPHLKELAIYDNIFLIKRTADFTLPHLRSLELSGDIGNAREFLQCISAPVIESLVITPLYPLDLHDLRSSDTPGQEKFATVKSVTLAPYHGHPATCLRLASECFPNVIDVTLLGTMPEILIAALGDTNFPNMQSLALRRLSPSRTETALISLISLRRLGDKPLRTLYLDKESIREMSHLHWFHDLEVEVVESDKWSILRRNTLLCDEEDIRFYPSHS